MFGEIRDLRRAGSAALDLSYVASGGLDGFWEIGLSIRDIEAGGVIYDIMEQSSRTICSGSLIAANDV